MQNAEWSQWGSFQILPDGFSSPTGPSGALGDLLGVQGFNNVMLCTSQPLRMSDLKLVRINQMSSQRILMQVSITSRKTLMRMRDIYNS